MGLQSAMPYIMHDNACTRACVYVQLERCNVSVNTEGLRQTKSPGAGLCIFLSLKEHKLRSGRVRHKVKHQKWLLHKQDADPEWND